jgi:hypothetical protein
MWPHKGLSKDVQSLLVAGLLVCCAWVWLALKATGILKSFEVRMGSILPGWFPLFNLIVLPVLVAVLFLRVLRSPWAILLIVLACSFCYTLIGLSYHRYPVATMIIHPLVLAEMFWIVPRLRKYREKKGENGVRNHFIL